MRIAVERGDRVVVYDALTYAGHRENLEPLLGQGKVELVLGDITDEARVGAELARILLDEMRRVLAIDVDCLTPLGFERLERESRQQLTGPWALGEGEKQVLVGTGYARTGQPGSRFRGDLNISGRSAFGRYLRRAGVGLGENLTIQDCQQIIADLLDALENVGLLTVVSGSDGALGYRIKASGLRLVPGDGAIGADDPLRKALDAEATPRVNSFFLTLYRDVAASLKGLHAKEHTAQVPPLERGRAENSQRVAIHLDNLRLSAAPQQNQGRMSGADHGETARLPVEPGNKARCGKSTIRAHRELRMK